VVQNIHLLYNLQVNPRKVSVSDSSVIIVFYTSFELILLLLSPSLPLPMSLQLLVLLLLLLFEILVLIVTLSFYNGITYSKYYLYRFAPVTDL